MIASKIGSVYEVRLPGGIDNFLKRMSLILSLGIEYGLELTPLECLNLAGYTPQMLFWIIWPLIVVGMILAGCALSYRLFDRSNLEWRNVARSAAPVTTQLLFFIYPIVTRHAFEAFSFYPFEDGSWLRADVRIIKGSPQHTQATVVAGLGIALYPIGLLVLCACLLFIVRDNITSGRPSNLSTAISFLHSEYRVGFFWCASLPERHTP